MAACSERFPLTGARVLVTRASAQARDVADHLSRLGAEAICCPLIEIAPPVSYGELDSAIVSLDKFGVVVFASANAVMATAERLQVLGRDIAQLRRASLRVIAIGDGTKAALAVHGIETHVVAQDATAEGLAAALELMNLKETTVLFPRAAAGREVLLDYLRQGGIPYQAPHAYRTVPVEPARLTWAVELLAQRKIDVVTLGSPMTARALLAALPRPVLLATALVAVIGPTTGRVLQEAGLSIDMVATPHTFEALVEGLATLWHNRQQGNSR